MTRIAIDLNVRVRGDLTYSGFEDIEGTLPADGLVEVYEPESGVRGRGRVVDVDDQAELVYLEVDWPGLRTVLSPAFDLGTVQARFQVTHNRFNDDLSGVPVSA